MGWADHLNQEPRVFVVGEYRFDILHWAYAEELADNVPHRHTYYEVCLVGRYGRGLFTANGVDHSIGPGDLFLACPGVVHQIRNCGHRHLELSWIAFTCAPLHSTSEGNTARRSVTISPVNDMARKGDAELAAEVMAAFVASERSVAPCGKVISSLWQSLRQVVEEPSGGAELLICHLIPALLLAIVQNAADSMAPVSSSLQRPRSARDDTVARLALRYIHDNLDRRLPLKEIAAHVHVSSRHLSRLIGSFSGTSPSDYIEQARIDRACSLLNDETNTIKEVASAVGYADVHHFSRVFHRRTGSPPGAFRRRGLPAPRIIRWPGDLV